MRKFQVKRALVSLLTLSLVALFAVGCGDSREDFVATGNNNVATGNLVFRFVQAQQLVPNGTTQLRFDFYSGTPISEANRVGDPVTVDFNPQVTLTVPVTVTQVTVTAIVGNVPVEVYSGNDIIVVAGGSTEVAFSSTQAVTFDSVTFTPDPTCLVSNGDTDGSQQLLSSLAFSDGTVISGTINNTTTNFSFARGFGSVANVNGTGLVTQEDANDNDTLTCAYTLNGVTRSDDVFVSCFTFSAEADSGSTISSTGGYTGFYNVQFRDDDEFTNLTGVNESSNTSYAFGAGAPSNLSINTSTGIITNTGGTTPTGTFDVIVTWVDGRETSAGGTGKTFTATITFTVDPNPS